jgi:hypothetical protein
MNQEVAITLELAFSGTCYSLDRLVNHFFSEKCAVSSLVFRKRQLQERILQWWQNVPDCGVNTAREKKHAHTHTHYKRK